jgi:hypothetical protein
MTSYPYFESPAALGTRLALSDVALEVESSEFRIMAPEGVADHG